MAVGQLRLGSPQFNGASVHHLNLAQRQWSESKLEWETLGNSLLQKQARKMQLAGDW